jgi:hypothetical protein
MRKYVQCLCIKNLILFSRRILSKQLIDCVLYESSHKISKFIFYFLFQLRIVLRVILLLNGNVTDE